MNPSTKKVITQLWEWVRVDYETQDTFTTQEEIDRRSVSFGITCKDVRMAAEELGIKEQPERKE